ncbi:MAG: cytochrome c nitrite reductase small subunit [Bryobacteraceae bacterium]
MPQTARFLMAVLIGLVAGLGAYTFRYAQGFSYFSNDPEVCANCHVMREYRDSWQKASHHLRAVCNDCHTPHALLPKYLAKAENGWNHSLKFTLQNFPDPIRIRRVNVERIEGNCICCHAEMVSEMAGLQCLQCHTGAGHGARPDRS